MNKGSYPSEIIDAYISGELSGIEKLQFEQALVKDPNLQQELLHQQDIIEGINTFRKQELKNRLSGIEVALVPAYVRYLRAAAISGVSLGVVSWSAWAIYNQFPNSYNSVENLKSVINHIDFSKELHLKKSSASSSLQLDANDFLAREKELQNITQVNPSQERILKENNDLKQTEQGNFAANTIENNDNKQGLKSDLTNTKEETQEILNNSNSIEEELSNTETKIEDNKKEPIRYQYYNEKLFMYGNVSRGIVMPMEINGVTKHFLSYEDKFYILNENQIEISEPVEVTDSLILEQLILRRDFNKKK